MKKPEGSPYQPIHEAALERPTLRHTAQEFEKIDEDSATYRGHDPESFAEYIEALQGREVARAFENVCAIARAVAEAGGRALLVGGSVRDEVLGAASKDFDVELYGISPEKAEEILQEYGKIDAVGKAFGILKVSDDSGVGIDVSFPRTDSKVGEGHRGFAVKVDPNMTIAEAAKRRDFTFNALAKDPLTGEIFDPFGGIEDLQRRTLRVTDVERFRDDPLRVMRAAQFIGRFGLRVDPESLRLIQEMVPELRELPKERMREEWDKLLTKSELPSIALQALNQFGVIDEIYPELAGLKGTPQEFEWHPEGDVWVHTLMVVDEAARVARRHELSADVKRRVLYAALCHDLGKPGTTEFEGDRIRSKGHEQAGVAPTKEFLAKIGMENSLVDASANLVNEHLWPGMVYRRIQKGESVKDGAFRKLADRLHPATIEELTYVFEADSGGRGPFSDAAHKDQFLLPFPDKAAEWTRQRAVELGIGKERPQKLLQGRDLINLGFKPGKAFGEVIALAEELRDDMSREELLAAIADAQSAQEAAAMLSQLKKG